MIVHIVTYTNTHSYRQSLRWVDGTIFYIANLLIYSRDSTIYEPLCVGVAVYNQIRTISLRECWYAWCDGFLCERKIKSENSVPSLPVNFPKLNESFDALPQSHPSLVMCPARHMVHAFLACDAQSSCGVNQSPGRCEVLTIDSRLKHKDNRHGRTQQGQTNDTESQPVHETVVSVDMFQCHEFGGTIPYTLVCDFREDCVDRSDETFCRHKEDLSMFR